MPPFRLHDIRWPARLFAAARSNPHFTETLEALGQGGAFADESDQTRPTDRPFIAAFLGTTPPATAPEPMIDEAIWAAVTDPRLPLPVDPTDDGPIRQAADARTIEVWTETEYGAIHALWTLGMARNLPVCQTRALRAAHWHVAHTQPDNATNTPWAIHVFALAQDAQHCPGADLLAQTLLHNCMIQQGHPDVRSSLILEHAARSIVACLNPTSGHPTSPG